MKKLQTDTLNLPDGESTKRGNLIIGSRPLVMGILNVTPDSFSDGGEFFDTDKAVEQAVSMVRQGADIIDIGGESTRPGSGKIGVNEEQDRVLPVLEKLKSKLNIPVSIDTRNSETAKEACKAGAVIINDISGLRNDENIAQVAKDYNAHLILMHMLGTPETMQSEIYYDDLINDILSFLLDAADKAQKYGVSKDKIIIDPGIGFGKTVKHNFSILKNISKFKKSGYPVLIGASRKSFIGKALNLPVNNRLEGSLAATVYAVMNGADIVRVHDVLPTVRVLKMIEEINGAEQ